MTYKLEGGKDFSLLAYMIWYHTIFYYSFICWDGQLSASVFMK